MVDQHADLWMRTRTNCRGRGSGAQDAVLGEASPLRLPAILLMVAAHEVS